MGLKIERIGRGLAANQIDNFHFEAYMDTTDEWIQKRTGIQYRYFSDEGPKHLALKAVEDLNLTEEEKGKIKVLIVTSMSMDMVLPSVASYLHGRLKLPREVMTFDMNMACTAFVGTLILVEPYLKDGEMALIVTSEVLSKYMDMEDRSSAILFGDGGAATLVTKTSEPFYYDFVTLPDEKSLTMTRREYGGDGKIHMEGKEVFRFATFEIPKSISRLMNRYPGKVDHYVIHQANDRIRKSIAKHFKGGEFYSNIANFGNTSSASIPLALWELLEKGEEGQFLLSGFGAGLTIGSVVVSL